MERYVAKLVDLVREFGRPSMGPEPFMLGAQQPVLRQYEVLAGDPLWGPALNFARNKRFGVELPGSTDLYHVALSAKEEGSSVVLSLGHYLQEESGECLGRFWMWAERSCERSDDERGFISTSRGELAGLGFSRVLDLILDMTRRQTLESIDADYMFIVRGFENDDGSVFLEVVAWSEIEASIEGH